MSDPAKEPIRADFLVFIRLYIIPAGKTKQHPRIKFASSPTPALDDTAICITHFIKHTAIPAIGPSANDASNAGRSEKSNFTKLGIKNVSGNSRYISIVATAPSTPTVAIDFTLILFSFILSLSSGNKKIPENTGGKADKYIRKSFLIRTVPSVEEFHLIGARRRSQTITAGMDLHHSPKIFYIFFGAGYPAPKNHNVNYSMIVATTPEPTVLPPSRIAKLSPFSIAIGVISSTVISTLSPGRHISTPSGSWIVPVTSVVLK